MSVKKASPAAEFKTKLRVDDPVMIVSGGNKTKRQIKGQTGKLVKILPKTGRVIVDGLNIVTRHTRASSMGEESGRIKKEAPVHISSVMYYHAPLERPVRLSVRKLDDGRKVRGFIHPETKNFEQIDA